MSVQAFQITNLLGSDSLAEIDVSIMCRYISGSGNETARWMISASISDFTMCCHMFFCQMQHGWTAWKHGLEHNCRQLRQSVGGYVITLSIHILCRYEQKHVCLLCHHHPPFLYHRLFSKLGSCCVHTSIFGRQSFFLH